MGQQWSEILLPPKNDKLPTDRGGYCSHVTSAAGAQAIDVQTTRTLWVKKSNIVAFNDAQAIGPVIMW
jgi:hypothetical protein